ncbi:MAG: alpha/beta hydrolase family protein [Asticcacaulis sp.]|uniref:alpha/beta hydrolase family protein n=1 Tax=Asticcacaulis sp. TaxID=1872648 RepID=UPI003F7CBD11
MNLKLRLFTACAAVAIALGAAPTLAAVAIPATAPSADDYGAVDRIASVSLAPDGQHVAAIVSTDGKTRVVAVFDLNHADQAPKIIPTAPGLDIQDVAFVKNDRMVLTLVQKFDIAGAHTHAYRSVITDTTGSFFQTLSLAHSGQDKENAGVSYEVRNDMGGFGGMSIESSLPDDPDNILARDAETGDIYRVNLHGSKSNFIYQKVYTGSEKFGAETWDLHHKDVLARKSVDFQDGHPYIAFSFRNPDTGAWEEHMRFFVKDREDAEILGFTKDPNVAILRLNHGQDKTAIYEYSIRERKLSEPLFANAAFDTTGVITSRAPADYGAIIGYAYSGPTGNDVYWDDDQMVAVDAAVKKALGEVDAPLIWTDAASGQKMKISMPQNIAVHIESMSNDRKTMIIEREGPKLPPEYYIYQYGKGLTAIGKSRPQIKPDDLGTTTLVQYPARDGLIIAAYLTKPNPDIWGKGPYPAIVVPHGGPWARDGWVWDPTGWNQYFAARGYVVIQPQYRTSTGWGQKIAREGDNQYGLNMSDDNDDAALWLVSQGLASKGHIALHGYSYGGFAAFEAGARSVNDDVFRCAIAGAGVADLERWKHYAGESRIQREALADTMTGLNPWDHVDDFKIPMLVYHGNRDQRVPFPEGKAMYDKLKAAGKDAQFIELQDMGHQINLWSPQNFHDVLTGVETFLAKDCGPGGIEGQ